MPKNIEDIIPKEKKSIRNVPVPDGRRKINIIDAINTGKPIRSTSTRARATTPLPPPAGGPPPIMPSAPPPPPPPIRPYIPTKFPSDSSRRGSSKKYIWIGSTVVVLAIAFVVMNLTAGATLSYSPRTETVSFNKDAFVAHKDTGGELLFSVIKLSASKGVEVPASGEESVSRKAKGSIVVYNDFSDTPQKLIKNTRFETPDGKIFRVESDINVPGRKVVDGDKVPGSLEITVVAAEPGDSYNVPPSDFTLPGLKGDPRFETIYARSKTAMTGGFVGMEKKVSPTDLSKAEDTLEGALEDELITQAQSQLPEGFIMFPELSSTVFESLPQTNQTASGATVNLRADFYGVMFKKSEFTNHIGQKKLVAGAGLPVDIPDTSTLSLNFVGEVSGDLLKATQITFQVDGSAQAEFVTDEESLKEDLAGKRKDEQNSILISYPSIITADSVVRPFWKSTFPNDASKIKIVRNGVK